MDTKLLEDLLAQYKDAEAIVKAAEEKRDLIKGLVKEALVESKLDKYTFGPVSASFYTQTRVMYDSKKLELLFKPSQLAPARKELTISAFTIRVAKEDKK
jgi:hypothetical protein